MADNMYNNAKYRMLNAYLGSADVRIKLLMSNTTCDTEVDGINNVSDFTTLDLCDATGYADVVLTESISVDDTNDWAKFDAPDISFSGLGGDGTRNYVGILVYEYVDGTDANDIPIGFLEFTTPITNTATQVNVPWATNGLMTVSQA